MATALGRRQGPAAGFTLVELLVAIVILLVGIVAVAQLVPASIASNFRNRYDSTSLIIAQRQLEQMLDQPMDVGNPSGLGAVANGPYQFIYTDPVGTARRVDIGQAPPVFGAAPLTPPPPGVILGAPLVAGTVAIDWSQARVANYWNRFATVDGYIYETRWNVLTVYGNIDGGIRPIAKRIILSTRGTPPGRGILAPVSLTTWVGDQ